MYSQNTSTLTNLQN